MGQSVFEIVENMDKSAYNKPHQMLNHPHSCCADDSDHQQYPCFLRRKQGYLFYKSKEDKKRSLYQALDVLYRSNQKALFAHILKAEHAGIPKAVITLSFGKGYLNCCFPHSVDLSADIGFSKSSRLVQIVLPDMPYHHPSL